MPIKELALEVGNKGIKTDHAFGVHLGLCGFFLVFFSHIRCFIRKCLGYNGVHETNKETSNRADP